MNKLKTVFQRSQKVKTEDNRRSQQFVKRHSSINTNSTSISTMTTTSQELSVPPSIQLSDLSELEKPTYESWWKDLDPFDLQKIDNHTILKFLNGCELPDDKLEKILTLFETAGDGLNKFQFFAMLRLIAHAQNGRKISQALVYLGAPIPHLRTNAFDTLIKTELPQRQQLSTNEPEENKCTHHDENRKSWWGGYEKPSLSHIENRRSYIGPFTTHTPIPNTLLYQQQPFIDFNTTYNNEHMLFMNEKQHNRSRSAGTANEFIPYFMTNQQEEGEAEVEANLQSSKSSLSLNELNNNNNGKRLLLTQKFVYQSPTIPHQDTLTISTNNPFYNTLQKEEEEELKSPFDDDQDEMIILSNNQKPNKHHIPPPPVPNQSTKPAFPKYARTVNPPFMIKQSQSTKINNLHHQTEQYPSFYTKLQRHNSATSNIIDFL
ncbi:uncharacterized protein BX663DRAFT_494079 [Cokeromyces recurvatus]|uniref:uncharacterized protein n=1 Tax=Cokeromyces recurvatus TaxID=90255 RepID=UPI00221E6511|nr:uncharacterized protein BX663DRAFT_494079 [Cokeromyces recurvatus]KAI7906882.1 hypothetical protein BX663DRAFT_494079 [Cokeromyces recurvatus]